MVDRNTEKNGIDEKLKADLIQKQMAQLQQMKQAFGMRRPILPSPTQQRTGNVINSVSPNIPANIPPSSMSPTSLPPARPPARPSEMDSTPERKMNSPAINSTPNFNIKVPIPPATSHLGSKLTKNIDSRIVRGQNPMNQPYPKDPNRNQANLMLHQQQMQQQQQYHQQQQQQQQQQQKQTNFVPQMMYRPTMQPYTPRPSSDSAKITQPISSHHVLPASPNPNIPIASPGSNRPETIVPKPITPTPPKPIESPVIIKMEPIKSIDTNSLIQWTPSITPEVFVSSLLRFFQALKISIQAPPLINGNQIHPYNIYHVVLSFGGYSAVTERQKWKTVCSALKIPPNFITQIKNYYLLYLFPYEQYYNLKKEISQIEIYRLSNSKTAPPVVNEEKVASIENEKKEEVKKEEKKEDLVVAGFPIDKLKEICKPVNIKGTVNFSELYFCIHSGLEIEECFSLNCLTKLSVIEDSIKPKQLELLLNRIVEIYMQNCSVKSKGNLDIKTKIENATTDRYKLNLKDENEKKLCILNIIRNWSLQKSLLPTILDPGVCLVDRMIIPSLFEDNFEVFANGLYIFSQVCEQVSVSQTFLIDFLQLSLSYIEKLIPLTNVVYIDIESIATSDSGEKLKKLILLHMNSLTEMGKSIHPITFLIFEVLNKLFASQENQEMIQKCMNDNQEFLLRQSIINLFRFVEGMISGIASLCSIITRLVMSSDATTLSSPNSWLTLINGNPNFGWPDVGYVELALNCIYYFKIILPNESNEMTDIKMKPAEQLKIEKEEKEMVKELCILCNLTKNLWRREMPLNMGAWQRSFIMSPNSNPFILLRRSAMIVLEYVRSGIELDSESERMILECVTQISGNHPNTFGADEIVNLFMEILYEIKPS